MALMWPSPQPFDPKKATVSYGRYLPHWRQPGAAYFVTFRLADSVPQSVLHRWAVEKEQWAAAHGPLTDERRIEQANEYGRRLLPYLDRGQGRCALAPAQAREHILQALLHFQEERYLVGDYAVMPNHVHALVMPLDGWELTDICLSWMKFTARAINADDEANGRFWQGEAFDHIVRDRVAYQRFAKYIQDNPMKAPKDSAESGQGALAWR